MECVAVSRSKTPAKIKTRPGPSDDLATSISAIRDMLRAFRALIAEINKISDKYKTSPSNFGKNMLAPDLVLKSTSTMSPERLGFFMSAMFEMTSLQDGLRDFMSYDVYQMKDLQNKMDSALEKFDKALEK